MKFVFTLLFSFCFLNCFAQLRSIEQLNQTKVQADSLVKLKKYDEAITLYENIFTGVPVVDVILHYEIAVIHYNNYEHKKTRASLDKAIVLSKKSNTNKMTSAIYLLYSRMYSKEGNNKKSLELLKKGLKEDDKIVELHVTLAYQYLKIGKPKKALQSALKAVEINPKSAYAHNNAGLALIKLKKYEEGKKMIMTSIELDGSNPYAYKHLAYYYINTGNLEKACEALKQAENLDYKGFGNEADQNEVEELIKKHCN